MEDGATGIAVRGPASVTLVCYLLMQSLSGEGPGGVEGRRRHGRSLWSAKLPVLTLWYTTEAVATASAAPTSVFLRLTAETLALPPLLTILGMAVHRWMRKWRAV